MKSINKVILIGTVGKDVETKSTTGGSTVAKFSLATNDKYKDRTGEWVEKTEWHNIVLWKKLAEIASQYIKKGSRVYIEGKLQTSSWDDKQSGQKKYMTEVVGQELLLLDSKPAGQSSSQSRTATGPDIDPNDLPF